MNVDAMLRGLTAKQFIEWECYARLEPFNELRADYRTASIASIIANVNRGKGQKPYAMNDFLLRFGEEEVPKRQTWQQQKQIAYTIAMAFNAPGRTE